MTYDIVLIVTVVALAFFVIGYVIGENTRVKPDPKSIEDYLAKNLPTEWAAYRKGVDEGYLQGLRDGQAGPGA